MNNPIDFKYIRTIGWLRLPETAEYLSGIIGRKVTEADILKLGLNGYLRLSIYFINPVYLTPGKVVAYKEAEWIEIPDDEIEDGSIYDVNEKGKPAYLKGELIDSERVFEPISEIIALTGVFDLPMGDGDRRYIESKFHSIETGIKPKDLPHEGIYVEKGGCIYRVQVNAYEILENLSGTLANLRKLSEELAIQQKISLEEATSFIQHDEEWIKIRDSFLENTLSDKFLAADTFPEDNDLIVRSNTLIDYVQKFINENEQNLHPEKFPEKLQHESFNLEISNSTDEDKRIEDFIKSVIADFPEATSKDFSAHCFASVKPHSREMRKIKVIMDKLEVERDSKGGPRTPEKIKYMEKAPKY